MAKFVAVVIPQRGFNEFEFHEIRKAFAERNVIALFASKLKYAAYGDNGEQYLPNMGLGEIRVERYDALIFLGGSGALQFHNDKSAHAYITQFHSSGKIVAALSSAVVTLANAGVLDGKKISCPEGDAATLSASAQCITDAIAIDGTIVTARDPKDAKAFGFAISDLLLNEQPL